MNLRAYQERAANTDRNPGRLMKGDDDPAARARRRSRGAA